MCGDGMVLWATTDLFVVARVLTMSALTAADSLDGALATVEDFAVAAADDDSFASARTNTEWSGDPDLQALETFQPGVSTETAINAQSLCKTVSQQS